MLKSVRLRNSVIVPLYRQHAFNYFVRCFETVFWHLKYRPYSPVHRSSPHSITSRGQQ